MSGASLVPRKLKPASEQSGTPLVDLTRPDIVDRVLQIDPNLVSKKSIPGGELPLHFAVKNPSRTNLNLVWKIAKAYPPGVSERTSSSQGAQTPLHVACSAGAPVAWIRLLHDTNPSARDVLDGDGHTPWEITKESSHCWRFLYRRSVRKILQNTATQVDQGERPGIVVGATASSATETNMVATHPGVYGDAEDYVQLRDGPENGLCVVCWDECANYAVIPCGHLCLCAHCSADSARLLSGKCPLCTRRIDCTVRIYQSGVHTPPISPSAPLEYFD
jgi:Zinc finger, C3HC4 type (RING finger)/Ankyrin repeats (many copies)